MISQRVQRPDQEPLGIWSIPHINYVYSEDNRDVCSRQMLFFFLWNMNYTLERNLSSSLKQTKKFLFLEWGILASKTSVEDSRLLLIGHACVANLMSLHSWNTRRHQSWAGLLEVSWVCPCPRLCWLAADACHRVGAQRITGQNHIHFLHMLFCRLESSSLTSLFS